MSNIKAVTVIIESLIPDVNAEPELLQYEVEVKSSKHSRYWIFTLSQSRYSIKLRKVDKGNMLLKVTVFITMDGELIMAALSKDKRKIIDKVLVSFGIVATVVLFGIGGLAWWTHSFISSTVTTELSAQKIYFPSLGSPALASPKIGPYLNQYAGKQLLTGSEAKAYANHFIAVHLSEVAGGQTYAQVSAASLANPSDLALKNQAQTLFQGETLRGLLLGDAYAFATVSQVAQVAAIVLFITGGAMLLLVLLGLAHLTRAA